MSDASPVLEAHPIIGGAAVNSYVDQRRDAVSPATGETLGSYPLCRIDDVDAAVLAAREAFAAWAATSVFDRAAVLERAIDVIRVRRESLARLLSYEQGKPYEREALWEVDDSVHNLRIAIEEAKRLEGTMPPMTDPSMRAFVYRVPRGVVAGVGPWNFPLGSVALQVGPALMTGNTVVALPAPTTTLSVHEWARCFVEAGVPEGVFNLLTGDGAVVGDALVGHPDVRVVSFTGSVATGEQVARRAVGKAQLLELGGNGPTVILDDADFDVAIPDAVLATFYCAGQNCCSSGRFLVHEAIYDAFAAALADAVRAQVRLGHPFAADTTMGPLNNEVVASKIDDHVRNALAGGAKAVVGGARAQGFPTDLYWQPTVLTGVTGDMAVANEETFGPVAPLQSIASEEEALSIMHASPYGLSASVYTRDFGRGLRFAERAPAGMININTSNSSVEGHLPFGGRAGKLSGIGRTQGRYPMEEIYTELKTVVARL